MTVARGALQRDAERSEDDQRTRDRIERCKRPLRFERSRGEALPVCPTIVQGLPSQPPNGRLDPTVSIDCAGGVSPD